MIEIIYQHFIENPQNKDLNAFQFAVINVHNEFGFYIEQTDVLGTNYWLDTYTYGCPNIDDEIYFHFYSNLNSNEIPEEIWQWLKNFKYSPYLAGTHFDHANQLKYNFFNKEKLVFPNKTLDSFKLLKEAILELKSNNYKYEHNWNEILEQLDIKMKELQ